MAGISFFKKLQDSSENEQITLLEKENDRLNEKIEEYSTSLAQLAKTVSSFEEQIEVLTNSLEDKNNTVINNTDEINNLYHKIDELNKEIEEKNTLISNYKQELLELNTKLEALLHSGDEIDPYNEQNQTLEQKEKANPYFAYKRELHDLNDKLDSLANITITYSTNEKNELYLIAKINQQEQEIINLNNKIEQHKLYRLRYAKLNLISVLNVIQIKKLNDHIYVLSKQIEDDQAKIQRLNDSLSQALQINNDLNIELQQSKQLNEQLNSQINAIKDEYKTLEENNIKKAKEINELTRENNNLRSEVEEYKKEIMSLRQQVDYLKQNSQVVTPTTSNFDDVSYPKPASNLLVVTNAIKDKHRIYRDELDDLCTKLELSSDHLEYIDKYVKGHHIELVDTRDDHDISNNKVEEILYIPSTYTNENINSDVLNFTQPDFKNIKSSFYVIEQKVPEKPTPISNGISQDDTHDFKLIPGATLYHKKYGRGQITNVIEDDIFVCFDKESSNIDRLFKKDSIEKYFEKRELELTDSVEITDTDEEFKFVLKPGNVLYHKTYGRGIIKKETDTHIYIVFDNDDKQVAKLFSKDNVEKYFEKKKDAGFIVQKDLPEEKKYLSKVVTAVKNNYYEIIENEVIESYKQKEPGIWYLDKFDDKYVPIWHQVDDETKAKYESLVSTPYFGRVDINGKKYYIGPRDIKNKVIDFASKDAQYYYQYNIYIDNPKYDLKLKRDLIVRNSNLYSYIDLYSKYTDSNNISYADEYLSKIIENNRTNNGVHNIIQTIALNQYNIMTAPINLNMVVYGCAGSGKTMIMYHRIRYLAYNNKDFDLKQVYLISPSKVLEIENSDLLSTLSIENINRYTVKELIIIIFNNYYGTYYHMLDESNLVIDPSLNEEQIAAYFDYNKAIEICDKVRKYYNVKKYRDEYIDKERTLLMGAYNNFNLEELSKDENIEILYDSSIEELEQLNLADISAMIRRIEKSITREKQLSIYKSLIELLLNNNLFPKVGTITPEYNILELENKFKYILGNGNDASSIRRNIYDKATFIDNSLKEMHNIVSNLQKPLDININNTDIYGYIANETGRLQPDSVYIRRLKEFVSKHDENFARFILNCINYVIDVQKELLFKKSVLEAIIKYELVDKAPRHYKYNDLNSDFNQSLEYTFKLFKAFDWDSNAIDVKYQYKGIKTPYQYFDTYYYIGSRLNRLDHFGQGVYYLFDLISSIINPDRAIYEEYSIHTYNELVLHTLILSNVIGVQDSKKKYIYFDEFQDLSIIEIKTIKNAWTNTVCNFYGDYSQCITPKGITDINELNKAIYIDSKSQFEIMENYRNAYEITNYVNTSLSYHMLPIGIKGHVTVKNDLSFNDIIFKEKDRIALIVKDKTKYAEILINKFHTYSSDLNKDEMLRGNIVLYSIDEIKGLEFEVVIVYTNGMSRNEKYLAFTRALNDLYVIENLFDLSSHLKRKNIKW